jgi:hypothetical protein
VLCAVLNVASKELRAGLALLSGGPRRPGRLDGLTLAVLPHSSPLRYDRHYRHRHIDARANSND